MIPSLLEIANELDLLGLHQEADALDQILQKRADMLAYKEKPFLARLAKIFLSLKKYKSGEIIKEDLTFPLTGTRLIGLTRQAAIEELQKHLKVFIEQYLIPTFDRSYKGTRFEAEYRQFISEVYALAQTLQGVFSTRSEQQSVREGMSAVEQVKKMVGHLIVFVRSREQLKKGSGEEAEPILHNAQRILGNLGLAIGRLDEKEVNASIKELMEIFPRKIDTNSPTYQLIVDAYRAEKLPFVRKTVVEDEAKERLGYEDEAALDLARTNDKKYNAESMKKQDLERHVLELEERLARIQAEAQEYEFATKMVVPGSTFRDYKELKQKVTTEPDTYLLPDTKVAHYKNKFRRYEVIAGDVSNLEKWLDRYKKRPEINQVISFSNFLSKTVDPDMAKKAFTIINRNIADLKAEVDFDLKALENSSNAVYKELMNLQKRLNEQKDQVVWEMWHEEYIVKMVQVLNYVLAPETRGEETSIQAFNKVLAGFNKLLNYEI